eukprot:TRINITY_DN14310_c1_g2_i1.p1 TRINITY_DN14310_c1_g2~~TRINITY_DN14310_c1_g2_i1.p1  ORF type:complete len:713 (+),score=77.87 TRINITY_DN14310_c1_g2_i1:314-2452(+)
MAQPSPTAVYCGSTGHTPASSPISPTFKSSICWSTPPITVTVQAPPLPGSTPSSGASELLARGLTRDPTPKSLNRHFDHGQRGRAHTVITPTSLVPGDMPAEAPHIPARRQLKAAGVRPVTSMLPHELPPEAVERTRKLHPPAMKLGQNPMELPAEVTSHRGKPYLAPNSSSGTPAAGAFSSPRAVHQACPQTSSGEAAGTLPPHMTSGGVGASLDTSSAPPPGRPVPPRAWQPQSSDGVGDAIGGWLTHHDSCPAEPQRSQRRHSSVSVERGRTVTLDDGLNPDSTEDCMRNALGTMQKRRPSSASSRRDAPWEGLEMAKKPIRRLSPNMRAGGAIAAIEDGGSMPAIAPYSTDADAGLVPAIRRSRRGSSFDTARIPYAVDLPEKEGTLGPDSSLADGVSRLSEGNQTPRIAALMQNSTTRPLRSARRSSASGHATPRGVGSGTPCRSGAATPLLGLRASLSVGESVEAATRALRSRALGDDTAELHDPPSPKGSVASSADASFSVDRPASRLRALSRGRDVEHTRSRSGSATPTRPARHSIHSVNGILSPARGGSMRLPVTAGAQGERKPRSRSNSVDRAAGLISGRSKAGGPAWPISRGIPNSSAADRGIDDIRIRDLYNSTLGALRDEIGSLQKKHTGLEQQLQRFQIENERLAIAGAPIMDYGHVTMSPRLPMSAAPTNQPGKPLSPLASSPDPSPVHIVRPPMAG